MRIKPLFVALSLIFQTSIGFYAGQEFNAWVHGHAFAFYCGGEFDKMKKDGVKARFKSFAEYLADRWNDW